MLTFVQMLALHHFSLLGGFIALACKEIK